MNSQSPAAPLPDLRGASVLIADDHPDTLQMFRQFLTDAGATVFTARSGAEALAIVQRVLPSIVVIDITMADRDVASPIAELRKLAGGTALPVIGMTGWPLTSLNGDWKALDFKVVLKKPVDPNDLCTLISKYFRDAVISPANFKVADLVSSPSKPDWVGEVVSTSRLRNGYVVVRWRTSSGTSLQPLEERTDVLVPLRPVKRAESSAG
jgi:two-component system sensor histidine kinase/response regulator